MLKIMLSAICVLAAATPLASGAIAAYLKPADIGGRWQGDSYTREAGGKLTLDIVACEAGWCGIKIGDNNACGATALKLDGGTLEGESLAFSGTLELARGTEPYVIHSYLTPAADGAPATLQLIGDTGGVFRAYRRSFPFEAQLTRASDPVCHAPATVSSAD
jgi:hypothetical protein